MERPRIFHSSHGFYVRNGGDEPEFVKQEDGGYLDQSPPELSSFATALELTLARLSAWFQAFFRGVSAIST